MAPGPLVATHTPTSPLNFANPTASNAAISSCRACTNCGSSFARPHAANNPLIPTPGYPKTCRTPHSRSRASRTSATSCATLTSFDRTVLSRGEYPLTYRFTRNPCGSARVAGDSMHGDPADCEPIVRGGGGRGAGCVPGVDRGGRQVPGRGGGHRHPDPGPCPGDHRQPGTVASDRVGRRHGGAPVQRHPDLRPAGLGRTAGPAGQPGGPPAPAAHPDRCRPGAGGRCDGSPAGGDRANPAGDACRRPRRVGHGAHPVRRRRRRTPGHRPVGGRLDHRIPQQHNRSRPDSGPTRAGTHRLTPTGPPVAGPRGDAFRSKERFMAAQVVVVTGASGGIGRAVATAFGARGASVALLARGTKGLAGAARDVRAAGGNALPIQVDVADQAQVFAAADRVEDELGPIDVWVNVAFTSVFAPFEKIHPDEYRRVTEVSYLGYVYGTMAALRKMKPRDRGTIVQVGSALAYRGIPLQTAYCGAKHAIQGFHEALRCELLHENSNVHVTMVQMPAVNTPQFSWVLSRLPHHAQPV